MAGKLNHRHCASTGMLALMHEANAVLTTVALEHQVWQGTNLCRIFTKRSPGLSRATPPDQSQPASCTRTHSRLGRLASVQRTCTQACTKSFHERLTQSHDCMARRQDSQAGKEALRHVPYTNVAAGANMDAEIQAGPHRAGPPGGELAVSQRSLLPVLQRRAQAVVQHVARHHHHGQRARASRHLCTISSPT